MSADSAIALLRSWGYPAVVLALTTGFASPIPEDLVLLACGYLISIEVFTWAGAIPASLFGILSSDCALFWLGTRMKRHHSEFVERLIFSRGGQPSAKWVRFGDLAVFIARVVPGTRAIVFFSAGMRRMRFARFLLLDGAGAVISTFVFLSLGAWLGHAIGGLDRVIQSASRAVLWMLVIAVTSVAVWRFFRKSEPVR